MKNKIVIATALIALLNTPIMANEDSAKNIFAATLVPVLAQATGQLVTGLISSLGDSETRSLKLQETQLVSSTGVSTPAYVSMVMTPAVMPNKLNTGLVYKVVRLDENAKEIETVDVSGGDTPDFTDKEKFAIIFSSNLPGEVTLTNVDPEGKVNKLGKYAVSPAKDNRYPKNDKLGMKFEGKPGLEEVKINFYPCLTQEALSLANVQSLRDKGIKECSNSSSYASKSFRTKSIINEEVETAETPEKINVVTTPYVGNELLDVSFKINHVSSNTEDGSI